MLVDNFIFQQSSLLREYPRGGDEMRARVSVLVASSRAAMPQVMRIIRAGNTEQRQAAGAGFALAARLCEPTHASTARLIERTAKAYDDPAFLREFDKFYKSKDMMQAEREDKLRAQMLRDAIGVPGETGGDYKSVELRRAVRVPLTGDLSKVKPITAPH